jgi:hypothetical protein
MCRRRITISQNELAKTNSLKRSLTLRTLQSMHLPEAGCAFVMPLAVCKKDVRTSIFPGKRNCSVVLHEIAVSGHLKLPDGD